MAGHRQWKAIRGDADQDPERRRRVEAARRDAEEDERAYEQSLAELRRARAYTQEQLAATLDVPQSQVSRIERQADLYVSTLARYLEAMGGRLELVGVFDDRRVPLALGDLTRPAPQPSDRDASETSTVDAAT
jgi:ribosome-binding protein aMBF1 (putative translation factor)